MKLKFKNQAFQEAATAAVCDVFEGLDNSAEVVVLCTYGNPCWTNY